MGSPKVWRESRAMFDPRSAGQRQRRKRENRRDEEGTKEKKEYAERSESGEMYFFQEGEGAV